MNPVNSMINTAAAHVKANPEELRKAVFDNDGNRGGPFGGNCLSSFFNWNPFGEAPIVEDYERWCWVHVHSQPEAEIIQAQADRALGKDLLNRMRDAIRKTAGKGSYVSSMPMCCSPNRKGDSLHFWINTGGTTQYDGWKTQDEVESLIATGEVPAKRVTSSR